MAAIAIGYRISLGRLVALNPQVRGEQMLASEAAGPVIGAPTCAAGQWPLPHPLQHALCPACRQVPNPNKIYPGGHGCLAGS